MAANTIPLEAGKAWASRSIWLTAFEAIYCYSRRTGQVNVHAGFSHQIHLHEKD